MYKDPQCGCCGAYAAYLRQHGFKVKVVDADDLDFVKTMYAVPERLQSCHTMIVGGYVVEGHVPLDAVERLLAEKPKIKGISLPGMPMGSPGIDGDKTEPFTIYEIGLEPKVFMTE